MTSAPLLPIRTERLVLRPWRDADVDATLAYYADPEVARHLLEAPWTREVAVARVAERVGRTGLDTPRRALALVVEHEGQVVGDVALWVTDETGAKGEVGWVFRPDVAGRGFATEAARALIDHAFDHYGMHRVVAELDARNSASAALCKRLGMRLEATHLEDLFSKGEWTDSLVYAVLASERPRDHGDAIVVSAVDLRDADGHVLTVRKRGTESFMHPGGKPEEGESPAQCALREVEEELGLVLAPEDLELLAVHRTTAANEAGRPLIASVFRHPHLAQQSRPTITPAAEIEEVRWTDPTHPLPDDVAPLLRWLVEREEKQV